MSPKLSLNKGDYVQVVMPNGDYRFGYISGMRDYGMEIGIQFYEEGTSKICFEEAVLRVQGYPDEDWDSLLSLKEREIVPLLAEGKTTKQVAEVLCCTESTIRSQVRILRIKLGLDNKTQLVSYCEGLLKKINGGRR